MDALGKRTIKMGVTVGLSLGAIVGLVGCKDMMGESEFEKAAAVESENGLSMNGLSMNGLSMNGLSMNGLSMNGLSMNGLSMNGLATVGGLSTLNGMMTTSGGRDIIKYMVRCALPAGQSFTSRDQNGTSYTFDGAIGIAPEAVLGPTCDLNCQEKVSACMLAHVNNSGAHIGIWLVGPDAQVGWGSNTAYPYQEGAFFGNLIQNPWQGYYCVGKDMGSGEVPGRLGTPLTSNVYTDPFGSSVACKTNCTVTSEGYTDCADISPLTPYSGGHKWTHPVTVWRNFEASQMYKICTKQSPTRCLGAVGGSTAEGAGVEQRSYNGTAAMQWQIIQVESGKYKFVNIGSGKVLDTNGNSIVQRGYTGAAGQKIPVVYFADQPGYANLKPSSGSMGISADSGDEGAAMKLSSNLSPDSAKWSFTALGTAPGTTTGTAGSTGTAGTSGSSGSSLFAVNTSYRIAPIAGNGVSVDLSGGSMANGNMLQLWSTQTGNNNQLFQFAPVGSNWKIVMNTNTNKCYDIGTANGSLLVINDCNGATSQSWIASYDGAAFQLKNAASNRCLDIPYGNLSIGVHPQIWDCGAGNNNQRFLISAATQ
jgi:hypothetical protein